MFRGIDRSSSKVCRGNMEGHPRPFNGKLDDVWCRRMSTASRTSITTAAQSSRKRRMAVLRGILLPAIVNDECVRTWRDEDILDTLLRFSNPSRHVGSVVRGLSTSYACRDHGNSFCHNNSSGGLQFARGRGTKR